MVFFEKGRPFFLEIFSIEKARSHCILAPNQKTLFFSIINGYFWP